MLLWQCPAVELIIFLSLASSMWACACEIWITDQFWILISYRKLQLTWAEVDVLKAVNFHPPQELCWNGFVKTWGSSCSYWNTSSCWGDGRWFNPSADYIYCSTLHDCSLSLPQFVSQTSMLLNKSVFAEGIVIFFYLRMKVVKKNSDVAGSETDLEQLKQVCTSNCRSQRL